MLTTGGRCTQHQRQQEQSRGSRQQRGYDAEHDKLRARWAPLVRTGTVTCWRCGDPISSTEPWHLGHLDDRTGYGGPEHPVCNLAAGGRARHGGGG